MGLKVLFQAALGRHIERRKNASAGEHVFRIRSEVVHAFLEQIENALDTLGQAAGQGWPDGHLEVFIKEKRAPPWREIVAIPDALKVRRESAFVGRGNEQVAAEIGEPREQRVGHIATVGLEQKLVIGKFRTVHIEIEHTAAVAFAVDRLMAGLQVGASH